MKKNYRSLAFVLCFLLLAESLSVPGWSEAKAKIRLNKTKATIYVGKTCKLKVKGTSQKVTWKSSKKKVATVSKKGVVKGIKKGTAKITAKVGNKKLICRVTVKKKAVESEDSDKSKDNEKTPQPTAEALASPAQGTGTPSASGTPGGTGTPDGTGAPTESGTPAESPTDSGTPSEPTTSPASDNPWDNPWGGGDNPWWPWPGGQQSKAPATPTPVPTPTPIPTPRPSYNPLPAPEEFTVAFSKESGSYDKSFDLLLSAPEGCTIYYTTDGSIPLSKEERSITGINFPEKTNTKKFVDYVEVRSRDDENNLLWTDANASLMYRPDEMWDGLDGASDPNIRIPKITVVRAVAVTADGIKSDVITKSYFVEKDLPKLYKGASVISVVTDPDNLLSEQTGIYRYKNYENSGKDWERPVEVTYIDEDGSIPFETTMGMRIHGGYSRRWGQKSLRLYFREELGGLKNLNGYQLIPGAKNHDGTEDTVKYKSFILRDGGNDYKYTKMADAWIQSLLTDRAYTTQECRPAVLYLNGEYWGLYNLTERYSDAYLETEFGVKKKNVISFKEGEWQEGQDEEADTAKYNELMALAKLDMTQDENYKKFQEMVDLQSFTDYFATQAYIANKDWPAENGEVKNIQIWRANEVEEGNPYADGKWRYMLYDTEFSMDLWNSDSQVGNPIKWAQRDPLFKAVSANKDFQKLFAATVVDLANNNFDPVKAGKKWDEMEAIYRPMMEQYFERWGKNGGGFDSGPDRKGYLSGRKSKMMGYLKSSFGNDILDGITQ